MFSGSPLGGLARTPELSSLTPPTSSTVSPSQSRPTSPEFESRSKLGNAFLWRCLKKEQRIEIDDVLVDKILHRQFVKSVKARVLTQRRKHAARPRHASPQRQAPPPLPQATTPRPVARVKQSTTAGGGEHFGLNAPPCDPAMASTPQCPSSKRRADTLDDGSSELCSPISAKISRLNCQAQIFDAPAQHINAI
eukprot:m.99238 g.99238  ORF g.99238 m.99238 type:complete len:194 (+) comp20606_c0_seq4:426-1007(+)